MFCSILLLAVSLFTQNLVAHKGGAEVAAQNTIPAFEAAIAANLSLECDVQEAKDGTLYLSHDARKDYAKAAKLGDLLSLVKKGVELQLDCKCKKVDRVIAAVRQSGAAKRGRIIFAGVNREASLKIRKELPECAVWMTVKFGKANPNDPNQTPAKIAERMKDSGACGISLRWNDKLCTPSFFAELKRLGVETDVWTIDDPKVAEEAIRRGARWVTTNKPLAIAKHLAAQRSPATGR